MGMPGLPELIIIGAVVLLLFGARKLPALGGAIGESIKNFKRGVDDKEPKLEGEKPKESSESQDS